MIIFENWIILEYQKLRNTQMEFILEKLIEIFDVWPNKIIKIKMTVIMEIE